MINSFKKIKNKEINLQEISEKIFLLGLFLLPSTMSLGILLILVSSIATLFFRKDKHIEKNYSILLICISFLMVASCIFQTLNLSNQELYGWEVSLTWLGLLNWIPFFFLFWSTQFFLKTNSQRINAAKFVISGSIPILITGFGQYFLNWQGPFKFLYGTIIWYLKPIENHLGLSGLFSNQNYTGTWLSTIWPLILGLLIINLEKFYKKSILIFMIGSFTFAIILTTSRNAILGIIISIPIVLGLKSLFLISIILLFLFFLNSSFLPIPTFLSENLTRFLPEQFIDKFNKFGFSNLLEYRRINLWNNTINLLLKKPIFGYGAAFFPIIYAIKYSDPLYTEQHTHNIFLEIASSYGLLVSILLIYLILSIFKKAYKSIKYKISNKKELIFSKSWFASSIIILLSQMNDITYYDGRISVILWILIAGLNKIGSENKSDEFINNSIKHKY